MIAQLEAIVYNQSADNPAISLLGSLWEGGGWSHWWTPNTGRFYTDKRTGKLREASESIWFPVNRPAPIPNHWLKSRNVYFGVHPTIAARKRWQRSTIATIGTINAVFAEFDVKDYGSIDAILAHLEDLPFYPSGIVHSGGGLHCYWLLSWPVPFTDNNRERFRRLQFVWVDLVGGDNGAKDMARVLRVPGSRNWKPAYGPEFPMVQLIEWRDMRRYDLARVEALVEERVKTLEAQEARRRAENVERTGDVAPGAAGQLLAYMVSNAAEGKRHNLARWGCGKLRAEGLADWAAEAVLTEFAQRVNWDDRGVDKEIAGIVRWHYSGGQSA